MPRVKTLRRLTATAAILPVLLIASACAPVQWLQNSLLGLSGGGGTTTTVIVCPALELPPEVAIAALEGSADPAVAEWANELDQHYDQLARCGR
jgi:hypothetical protein